jgi:hypothetical protein
MKRAARGAGLGGQRVAQFHDDAFTVGPQSGPVAQALIKNLVEHTGPT